MLEATVKGGDLAVVAKMREGYEAAVIRRMKETGFLEMEIRVECLQRCGESYADPIISAGWHYWQASREAVAVEVPTFAEAACKGTNHLLRDFRNAIEAQGLKVAPAGEIAL